MTKINNTDKEIIKKYLIIKPLNVNKIPKLRPTNDIIKKLNEIVINDEKIRDFITKIQKIDQVIDVELEDERKMPKNYRKIFNK